MEELAKFKKFFKRAHFSENLSKEDIAARKVIISSEIERIIANRSFSGITFRKEIRKGNDCYIVDNIAKYCVISYLGYYLSSKFDAKVGNRNDIIRSVKSCLRDSSPIRVIRLDISKFFESIDLDEAFKFIVNETNLPFLEFKLLSEFIHALKSQGFEGVPRGVPLSSVISEIYMKVFDKNVSDFESVIYYSRYVDDIIIVKMDTVSNDFDLEYLKSILPCGLNFNVDKQKVISVPRAQEGFVENNNKLEFLGYRFSIYNSKDHLSRKLSVGLSSNKLKELKRRLSISFKLFCKGEPSSRFRILEERVRYITGNFILPDKKYNRSLKTGIYYNYPEIDDYSELRELDRFLKMMIFSTGCRISNASNVLTLTQKRVLSKYSFVSGHESIFLKKISVNSLLQITGCFRR